MTLSRRRPFPSVKAITSRGFNLIEAAIVLGVVGLVIGGIWVGAATVNENIKVNKTSALLNSIITYLNQAYQGIPDPTATTSLTSFLLSKNVIPPELASGSGAVGYWGNALTVDVTTLPTRIRIRLSGTTVSQCIKIATAVTANPTVKSIFLGIPIYQGYMSLFEVRAAATNLSIGYPTTYAASCNAGFSSGAGVLQLSYYFPAGSN